MKHISWILVCTALAFFLLLGSLVSQAGAQNPTEVNLAYNPTGSGYPHPLESDPGWGGGSFPWEMLDGKTFYTDTWAHGLAFTGGFPGWWEPCGWRQATIDFGETKTFNRALVWHHGWEHIPTIYHLEYWDGAAWQLAGGTSSVRYDLESPPPGIVGWGAVPTEHIFPVVAGSKIRFVVNNCDIQHGWIYEFEVFQSEQPVSIDINPKNPRNPVKRLSTATLPVAILSTSEFDATAEVDVTSLTFGKTGSEASLFVFQGKVTCFPGDVNLDKLPDLTCLFSIPQTGFACGDTAGVLLGRTTQGISLRGSDGIDVRPCLLP